MGLADELPELIRRAEEFERENPEKAGRNLANAEIFLVVDLDAAKVQPIHWLFHVRGKGSFLDNKRSNQDLGRFRPILATMGYMELSEGDDGFDAVWRALMTACARFGLSPSMRAGKVAPTGRSFFVKAELPAVDRVKVLAAFDEYDRTGMPDGFRDARKWYVLHPMTGSLYPAKIVWGIASGGKGREFTAHEARNWLRKLEFECVNLDDLDEALSPENVPAYFEGAERQITRNVRERDPKARAACIEHYRQRDGGSLRCLICRMDFEETYGPLGAGFIHVHHLDPLAESGGVREVSPEHDLVLVCPNCHAMLHRQSPPLMASKLVGLMREASKT